MVLRCPADKQAHSTQSSSVEDSSETLRMECLSIVGFVVHVSEHIYGIVCIVGLASKFVFEHHLCSIHVAGTDQMNHISDVDIIGGMEFPYRLCCRRG